MSSARFARERKESLAPRRFALYVEGPRDCDILRSFAGKVSPKLARRMGPCIRILGGRRPARAAELFRELSEELCRAESGVPRGLCVLDRDDPRLHGGELPDEPRLDYFVWGRRHIESYLMVPAAIRRCLDRRKGSRRDNGSSLDRLLADEIPSPDDEPVFRDFDAKRLLARKGPIASKLGTPLNPGEIVRFMSRDDVHADVCQLLDRVREGLDGALAEPH
jgi:hypothetical protein